MTGNRKLKSSEIFGIVNFPLPRWPRECWVVTKMMWAHLNTVQALAGGGSAFLILDLSCDFLLPYVSSAKIAHHFINAQAHETFWSVSSCSVLNNGSVPCKKNADC